MAFGRGKSHDAAEDSTAKGQEKEKKGRLINLPRRKEKDAKQEAREEEEQTTISEKIKNTFQRKKDRSHKLIVYKQFGEDPLEVLEEESTPVIPEPEKPDDVASSVSYNDCVLRRGLSLSFTNPVCLPNSPGMDVIGDVAAVGKNVEGWQKGDRVAAFVNTGGNARYIVVPSNVLVPVPRVLDAAEAVCMVSTYMTAWQSLQLILGDEKSLSGKRILIVGGIDPVCQALIQLSNRAGAEKVYCTAPGNKHKYVKSVLGAKPLPMRPDEWLPLVEGKMDVVYDQACQDGFDSSKKALDQHGTLVCVGMYAMLKSQTVGIFGASLSAYWTKAKAKYFMSNTKFYQVHTSFRKDPETFKKDLEHLFQLLRKREIKPHIAKRVALADVPEAQSYLEAGRARGAIVCFPWRRRKTNLEKEKEKSKDNERE